MSTHAAASRATSAERESSDQFFVDAADIEIARRGGVLIFPTETIYGLGCDATNAVSVERVFAIKERAPDKPPPVLIANEEQLQMLVSHVSSAARALMQAHWPGALTLVLPARDDLCPLLAGRDEEGEKTIAVRHSSHPIARALCLAMGAPLVATSANRAGAVGNAANPRALDDIESQLKAVVDCVIDGGIVGGQPSTILGCTGPVPRLLRQGAIVWPGV